jgi:hypothetical protein
MRIYLWILMRQKTNLTLHPAVKQAALALAESQGRSLSELVERLLEREVDKASSPSTSSVFREEPSQYSAPQYSGQIATAYYQAKPRSKKGKPRVET